MIKWFWLFVLIIALVLIVFPDSFIKLLKKLRRGDRHESK